MFSSSRLNNKILWSTQLSLMCILYPLLFIVNKKHTKVGKCRFYWSTSHKRMYINRRQLSSPKRWLVWQGSCWLRLQHRKL